MAVRNAIQRVQGVSSVTVEGDRVTVSHEGEFARDQVVEAVKRAGYRVAN